VNETGQSNSDLLKSIYCPGCNGRFLQSKDSAGCPRCGASLNSDSEILLDETLLIHFDQDDANASGHQKSHLRTELEQLLGSELHIYQLNSMLGSGGMGSVFLAHHQELDRHCALKLLSPQLSAKHSDYVDRFFQEGKAAAALNHPNIVTTHAIGEARGYHFLEMEYVRGRSLQYLIQHEGRLLPDRAVALCTQVAVGLASAHRTDIVHRDLKPDNIMITHEGVPKIADFGLAKRILSQDEAQSEEGLMGTPNFMAPELFAGSSATPSSDVYALGVCLYLTLTGKYPFVGSTINELMTTVTTQPLPNIREIQEDIPLELAECISLLLAKSPQNRPQDGIEAAQLLHATIGDSRDIESLLSEAFRDEQGISWTRENSSYRLHHNLPDGRSQTVFLETSDHSVPEKLLLIYSTCCPAKESFYEEVLRLNSEVPHGGIAIREIDGKSMFVMIDTFPRSTVGAEEIRRSVLEVAFQADTIEKRLTGLDKH